MSVSKQSSGLGMMLIISAIDMLIASLVCMVAIFVVLVGSDVSNVIVRGGAAETAPSILQVCSPDGGTGVTLNGLQGQSAVRTVPIDDLGKQVLPGNSWLVQTFIIPPGQQQFILNGGQI